MAIFNSIIGYVMTLDAPFITKLVNQVQQAETSFQKAISDGDLMKHSKEREADALDAESMIKKYVETYEDGEGNKALRVNLAELAILPFAKELSAELVAALDHKSSPWIVDSTDEEEFGDVWARVVKNARDMRAFDKNERVLGSKGSRPNLPWKDDMMEAGLNAVFAPVYDAVRDGHDPKEVENRVKLGMNNLADGSHDLVVIRMASIIKSLRTVVTSMQDYMDDRAKKVPAEEFAQRYADTKADAKRAGRGGRGFIAGLGRVFGQAATEAGMNQFEGAPFHGPRV